MRIGDMRAGAARAAGPATTAGSAAAPGGAGQGGAFAALLGGPACGPAGGVAAAPATIATIAAASREGGLAAVAADRTARRHGRAMLKALRTLHLALLAPGDGTPRREALEALGRLAGAAPEAADPVLQLILREIAARAAVEIARADTQGRVSIG